MAREKKDVETLEEEHAGLVHRTKTPEITFELNYPEKIQCYRNKRTLFSERAIERAAFQIIAKHPGNNQTSKKVRFHTLSMM